MNEKCYGCGEILNRIPGGVEVSFHGFVSLIILGKRSASVPIAKGVVGFCRQCAEQNKVPFLEGAVFLEVLRATTKNKGKN